MDWLIGAAAVLFVLCLLAAATPITVTLHIQYRQQKQDIHVTVTIWHVFYKTIHLPLLELDEETGSILAREKTESSMGKGEERKVKETPEEMKSQWDSMQMWLGHINHLRPLLFRFLHTWKIKKFRWNTRFGTGDAAWTGFISGMAWTVKQTAGGLLSAVMKMTCRPDVSVSPEFQRRKFESEFLCMVTVRAGHAIITGIRVVKHVRGDVFALWKKSRDERRREEAS
ncbi:DUF2953 domain-containing protein [Salibacterium halotolerans]|uniref:DUF2953 domain-containing protein n=1 Tax=Salibacterium halotolerans TaxID=1884432 RepID=A0A1I5VI31_9BACI|nr:DUF2953 domain-containing protein [Salibacterium halotolerans]SFQ07204.1 Protein of unknown function [Salibacterium halotolerans]